MLQNFLWRIGFDLRATAKVGQTFNLVSIDRYTQPPSPFKATSTHVTQPQVCEWEDCKTKEATSQLTDPS